MLHKNYKVFNTKIRIISWLTPDPGLTNPDPSDGGFNVWRISRSPEQSDSQDVILIYMSLDPTEVSNNPGQGDWTMYPSLE